MLSQDNQSSGTRNAASSQQLHRSSVQTTSNQAATLWQHPYVDVFKHFKVVPQGDWRQNKKQGSVEEVFVKEIGRKALNLAGSISANNFVLIPHPTGLQKTLGLTGRYIYLEVKSSSGTPFTLHFDFSLAERSHNSRISVSNLFKQFATQNGQNLQVPLELQSERWTVVCLDVYELLVRSQLFPAQYNLDGAHTLKSIQICSSLQIRGVYTSDNDYDFVTLPSELRFKFPFDNTAQVSQKWLEYFDWQRIPGDWGQGSLLGSKADRSFPEAAALRNKGAQREEERKQMQSEINQLLSRRPGEQEVEEDPLLAHAGAKKSRLGKLPDYLQEDQTQNENLNQFNLEGGIQEKRELNKRHNVNLGGIMTSKDYVSGQYCGLNGEFKRSPKLNQDPIIELKHIIGYSPDKCLNLKWSRFPGDPNVVVFTSGGTLIAMDVESNQQKRFFFGHSAPICCFDINANGALIASAQEGKNSIIRIWEYTSGRCISMMTMPVNTLKCLAFSYDGKYLASVGKDSHNKELIVVWDITRIGTPGGGKPEIVAKQTADFNILQLKFSPIDSSRMASCGKENIRFWRIKDNGSIRGSAVVLNHHARNTVFTCLDFEYGLRSVDPKENESLKRLFVGSKHGMVFQVNYHTEALEATYQTNDSSIYGISVNEAFCVTGSEDTYLRVWPLDFSEFFMEAKHEGTVCSVEISPDGLKVACGTLNGSLGVLDKSNQRYRTVLRSHTDQILQMDYHLGKRIVITVSKDKTIRLWDVATQDQVYEFSSPVDQALCVSAHPTLPLFSCGFESGVMRVFDIERTCVADEFCQFNKPLAQLAYSPQGDLLVSCCVDGGVAIHNPKRQHLPIKMLHLEFPPEFVHVAFTQLVQGRDNTPSLDFVSDFSGEPPSSSVDPSSSAYAQGTSKFAVMGEYGNNVNVYDSHSLIVCHQIQAQQQLKQFLFANNNRELVVMTSDCKIRFYSLARFEGILLREINAVHRGSITSLSVSNNSGYLLTGGEDSLLKVWDYEAQKTVPYFFQAFIGHTYPVRSVMFCPNDNSTVLSVGDKDGIYLWSFQGDVRTQFAHQPEESVLANDQEQQQLKKSKSGSVLEKLRISKKEAKQLQAQQASQLKDGSFIVPAFKAQPVGPEQQAGSDDHVEEPIGNLQIGQQYFNTKREKGLTYNHFALSSGIEIEAQPQLLVEEESQSVASKNEMKPLVVNGYDGFGGTHDNIVWNQEEGWMVYTLHNKVIFESVKTREQTVISDSVTQLSTMALSKDKKLLAVGEGRPNSKTGNALIYLYDTQSRKLVQRYTFHQRGVQALAFSNSGAHLISIGVQGENNLALWDLQTGLVVRSCLIKNTNAVNGVVVDPYVGSANDDQSQNIQFAIFGNQGLYNIYRYEIATQLLQAYEVDNLPVHLQSANLTSLAYSQYMNGQGAYFAYIGAADGSLSIYDLNQSHFVDFGTNVPYFNGEIGHVRINNQSIVLATSLGAIDRFNIHLGQLVPNDKQQVQILRADGPVTSLAMDDLNNEGLVGTANGALYYINFNENIKIRIVSKAYSLQAPITSIKFNENNPQLIVSNCSNSDQGVNGSVLAKVWTTQTLDQVMRFGGVPLSSTGPVAFVLSGTNGSRYTLIGHQQGLIRLVNLECLKVEGTFKIALQSDDEVITSGIYNPNGINLAVGTSNGNIYFGSIREDSQGRPKVMLSKLEIAGNLHSSVVSLNFSKFDPIGSFLASYDNGTVRTWQSSVRNEQLMKLLELQQHSHHSSTVSGHSVPLFDLSENGFQQFDIVDRFDLFENPHGLDEVSEEERTHLKLLYTTKRHRHCQAQFSPSRHSPDMYLCLVQALQYVYLRNYVSHSIVKRVSLMHFPTCFVAVEYNQLWQEAAVSEAESEEEEKKQSTQLGGEQVLALVGTKEGKVLAYKISSAGNQKLSESRSGLSFGGISAIDVSTDLDKLVAATESGEIFTADIISNIERNKNQ